MKKSFVTGLILLLPATLTIAIAVFVFNFLTVPFVGLVKSVLSYYGMDTHGFLFLTSEQVLHYSSQLLVLVALVAFTVALGALARWVFFHYLVQFGEYILHRIPLVSTIYKTTQDVIKTIFSTKNKSFKQVVMVPFPNKDTHSIGLVTRDEINEFAGTVHSGLVAVFVPTTPNPTSGFLMMFKQEDIVYLDMSVENALKYVISCGVVSSPIIMTTKEELLAKTKAFEGILNKQAGESA
jgi:uncharacterized membrane protein